MRSLLTGLKSLSDLGLVHRDLKPENIVLRSPTSLEAAIMDYSSATLESGVQVFGKNGTAGFVAPEVLSSKGRLASCKSDVFSAGVIFHFLLLGRSIFDAKDYDELLDQNRICAFRLEGEDYDGLPPSALNLLRRMLEVDVQNRTSAEEALRSEYFQEQDECAVSNPVIFKNSKSIDTALLPLVTSPNSLSNSPSESIFEDKKRGRESSFLHE